MKRFIRSGILAFLGLWCVGFIPGFVTSRDILVSGDPEAAARALAQAVVELGGKVENTPSRPNHWFSIDPDKIGFAAEDRGTHLSIGFDPKGSGIVQAYISCGTLEGCSGRRVLQNGIDGWVEKIVSRAAERSGIVMRLKTEP
jgi:hypothetical protein